VAEDLAFSPDGKGLFVAVGSVSNVDDPDDHPRGRIAPMFSNSSGTILFPINITHSEQGF
jgi:hypothetical protein